MAVENPYRSPQEPAHPIRRSTWAGTTVILLAILIYLPMTIGPLVRAIAVPSDFWPMIAAFTFNGAVFAGLLRLGVWLRKRAARDR